MKDFSDLIKNNKLFDISYKTIDPEEVIHPRIVFRENQPCVYNKKDKHIPIEKFLHLLAENKIGYVTGYRRNNRQSTITFSNFDRVTISPRLQGILKNLRTNLDIESKSPAISAEFFELKKADNTSASMLPTISQTEQDKFDLDTKSLSTDEREAIVKVRFGQGNFRDALIKINGESCWMTGMEGKRLLIASHIKPWSHCEESRGEINNGLLISALWDSAFDSGLITFDENWKVVASSELSETAKAELNINQYRYLPETYRNELRASFISYHRDCVFENWKK